MQKAKLKTIGWMLIIASLTLATFWQAFKLGWFLVSVLFYWMSWGELDDYFS